MSPTSASEPDSHLSAREIHSRKTLGKEGLQAVEFTVQCPLQGHEVPLAECLACLRCAGLHIDPASRDASVVCGLEPTIEAPAPQPALRPPPVDPGGPAASTPVSEIMTTHVLCVRPDLPLAELVALFIRHGISGAPVVDDQGRPIGVVSKTDLVREQFRQDEMTQVSHAILSRGDEHFEIELDAYLKTPSSDASTVEDVMMPVAFCLPANESVARAAALMAFEGVHRIPVVGPHGEVVGLVSPLDVLRWLATAHGFVVGPLQK